VLSAWEDACGLEGYTCEKAAYCGIFGSGDSVCLGGRNVCQQNGG